jgi:hypothetical protein
LAFAAEAVGLRERPDLLAWLLGFRRLGIRYDRCAEILEGLLSLACSLMCVRLLSPSPP